MPTVHHHVPTHCYHTHAYTHFHAHACHHFFLNPFNPFHYPFHADIFLSLSQFLSSCPLPFHTPAYHQLLHIYCHTPHTRYIPTFCHSSHSLFKPNFLTTIHSPTNPFPLVSLHVVILIHVHPSYSVSFTYFSSPYPSSTIHLLSYHPSYTCVSHPCPFTNLHPY